MGNISLSTMKLNLLNFKTHYFIASVGWISKIISSIFLLINTRIFIELVYIEGFTVYHIIYSLFGWMSLLIFGFPPAIQVVWFLPYKYFIQRRRWDGEKAFAINLYSNI